MSEFELDGLLSDAVADYRAQTAAQVRPPGVAATRASAQHRHRVHMIAGSALVAAALIVPVAAYAAIGHAHRGLTPAAGLSSPTPTGSTWPSRSGPAGASQSGSA